MEEQTGGDSRSQCVNVQTRCLQAAYLERVGAQFRIPESQGAYMSKPAAQNPTQGDAQFAEPKVDRNSTALARPKSDIQLNKHFNQDSVLKHGHTPRALQGKKSIQGRRPS